MRRLLTTTAALALVVGLSGCAAAAEPGSASPSTSAPPPSLGASPSPSGAASASSTPEPDGAADRVADDVAERFWASDTRTDTSPADAARRATAWLTPEYAEIATEEVATGASWQELADHEGRYVVEVTDVDDATGTADTTSTTATRVRLVTLTPTGAQGWKGQPRYLVATFTLANEDGPWLVSRIDVEESLTGVSGDERD